MVEQEIQRKIEDFRELGLPPYTPREGSLHLVDHMVSTVIGARRSGKSFRVKQAAQELFDQGFVTSLQQICPLDFDNPILANTSAENLSCIQNTFLKMNPSFDLKTPLVFILDEIHRIDGWEEYVIDLSRNPHWKVIVTGSSSKLLKDDLATALRGKAISTEVYPLSFSEFLRFHDGQEHLSSTKGQARRQALFEEYLHWGGYPALPKTAVHSREVLLREYFDTMILKDIVQRFNVSKPQQCAHLYHYLLSNIGRAYTIKSALEYLKQSGYTTSREAIRDYIAYAEDAWLLFTVPIHTHSQKEQARNHRKVYSIDWGLAIRNSLVWDGSYSQALENMIYLHLKRNYPRVRYYLTKSKRQEVDFLVSDEHGKTVLAVQVCQDISHADTLQRELDPLFAAAKFFNTKKNLVITLNQQETFTRGNITAHAIPAWKWLLKNNPPASDA